jgi:hypothetical protein
VNLMKLEDARELLRKEWDEQHILCPRWLARDCAMHHRIGDTRRKMLIGLWIEMIQHKTLAVLENRLVVCNTSLHRYARQGTGSCRKCS